MPVVSPQKRDLSTWLRSPEESDSREVWEISAPPSNSLFWSLMCSYLIKSSASGNLAANIERITGTKQELSEALAKMKVTEKPDIKRIENRVKNINPFKNAHTLYYDKDLATLMRVFKPRLNRLTNELKREGEMYDDYLKVQSASTAFCCQIDLYEEDSGNKNFRIFMPKSADANSSQRFTLIIFKYKGVTPEKSIYKMGFEQGYSQTLRVKALKHILPLAKVHSQQILTILNSAPPDKFLHHLLVQGSVKEAILMIFESFYVLKKLSDAGYDVDPLSIGPDGFSSFYHCMRLNDWDLLFLLYNYVTTTISTQELAKDLTEVLNRLRNVKRILDEDCTNSQNFLLLSSKQKEAQFMFSQIQLIIKFQREVYENIISISNSLHQAHEKQNRVMACILTKYDEYFYFNHRSDNQFLDYVKYYNYHKYVDDYTFLLFFDYFLSLTIPESNSNECLVNNSLIYILEYLISKNIFQRNYHDGTTKDSDKELFVPFCYRMKLKKTLSTLNSEILETSSSNKNISTTDILIHCLKTHPMLEEEFQISRFKEYLKIGGNVSFENSNTAAPFAIERTLQVIGETLSTIRDDSVITPLIKYSFPSNLATVLCGVRNNCLSHLRIGYAQGRKELEKSEILKKIQAELNVMRETFEGIFMLQTLRVKKHMIEYGMSESQVYPDHIKDNLTIINEEIAMLKRNYYRNHTDMYLTIAYKIITSLINTMQHFNASKMKEVRRDYRSLKFLLHLISEYCNADTSNKLDDVLKEIDLLIDDQKKAFIVDDILTTFLFLQENFKSLFKNISNSEYEIDLSNTSALFSIIKEYDFFKDEEKKKIKESLLNYFEKPEKAKQQLIDHANKRVTLDDDQIKRLFNEIITTEKTRKELRANLSNLDKLLPLFKTVNLGELFEKDEQFFIDFVHILSDDKFRDIIPNLCLPKNLHSKIADLSNQKLQFLKERMNLLEKILIEENSNISSLRKYGASPECKDHVKRLIRLRYMEEEDTRAAIETLLLDCLEIINKRKCFQDLFTKTSNFFCGINLRNFLSHGCPILETAIDHLHPNDLPRELIEITLKLIDDQKGLNALIQLWEETKNPKIAKLKSKILETTQDKYSSLRDIITKCDKWENYLVLLPIK